MSTIVPKPQKNCKPCNGDPLPAVTPPRGKEATEALLRIVLDEVGTIPAAASDLPTRNIYDERDQKIWQAMLSLSHDGKRPGDLTLLVPKIREIGFQESVNAYLGSLMTSVVPHRESAQIYVDEINEAAQRRQLKELLEDTWPSIHDEARPIAKVAHEIRTRVDSIVVTRFEWPEPKPLPGLPPVEPFDVALLPNAYRGWVEDIAERMQCPPDFPAAAAIVVTSSVVGRQISIFPKRRDNWRVVPNLFGAIVGAPSQLKTPATQPALSFLQRLEILAREEFEQANRNCHARKLVSKAREKERDKAIQAAVKAGGDAESVAAEWIDNEDREPIRRRYISNDCTPEKLADLLNENPRGLMVYRDELTGLLRSLDKEGSEGARAFYLEAWNGDGRFTVDRIGRGTKDVDGCCLTVFGSIQPGPLREYLHEAIRGGRGDDGLVQRFQMLVWPDASGTWRNVDRWPDTDAKNLAWQTIQELDKLTETGVGVPDKDGGLPYCRFTAEAQELFDSWRADLESRLRNESDHESLVAHLAKYRSLIPSLALLTSLADGNREDVNLVSLEKAVRWGSYLESHARRIYGSVVNPGCGPAANLAKRVRAGELPDGFTARDVYNRHWSGLNSPDDAREALEVLVELDWLRCSETATGGRPTKCYSVNPRVISEGAKVAKATSAPFAPSVPGGTSEIQAADWDEFTYRKDY